MTTKTDDKERAAFEAWVRTRAGHPFAGAYLDLMWFAWQARAALGKPVRRPYAQSDTLGEYGIIPECDTRSAASAEPSTNILKGLDAWLDETAAPVAQEPIATLHGDGYWTWKKPRHQHDAAFFKMDVYAAPIAAQPSVQNNHTQRFMADVAAELDRARAKFPGDRIMTIALAEEFGELAKAMLDEPGANVWKEAVQTAVMAARVAIDGDSSVDEWRTVKGLDNHRNEGHS